MSTKAEATGEKRAPVQGYRAGIPWEMHLRAYDVYCKEYRPQEALIEGGCRGGFSTRELDRFIPGWREELSERAAYRRRIEDLTIEIERLNKLVYVPGVWRCARCSFTLLQSSLNANTGTVTARDQPGDKCPNCDSPLWRVSERDYGNERGQMAEEQWEAARAAKAEATRLREALELAIGNIQGIADGTDIPSTAIREIARAALATLPGSAR